MMKCSLNTDPWIGASVWCKLKSSSLRSDGAGASGAVVLSDWLPGEVINYEVICNNSTSIQWRFIIQKLVDSFHTNSPMIVEVLTVSIDKKITSEFVHVKRRDSTTADLAACSDLTMLNYMNEPEILRCLHDRFMSKPQEIYTSIGPILIAINPFKHTDLYSSELMNSYFDLTPHQLQLMKPHIFQIAARSYLQMINDRYNIQSRENQSLLVSGESGAGKTESMKHVLRYLALYSSRICDSLGVECSGIDFSNLIMAVNPIAESFGNAKTIRNNNSSRFGKLIELFYSADGYIDGASITTYLLETIRLTRQVK